MKRLLACTVLGLALSVPNFAQADEDYRHHMIVHGPFGVVGDIVALPFIVGATVVGAAATVATAPFYALDGSEPAPPPAPAPTYYAPPRPAYYAPPAVYTPPPAYVAPRPVYYAPPPVYVAPRPVYYAPPRVYYRPAPVYVAPGYAAPGYAVRPY